MPRHTPGPWLVVGPALNIEAEPHGLIAATRYLGNSAEATAEHAANAALIAAAPELRAALEKCATWLECHRPLQANRKSDGAREALHAARAVLAKVRP